MSAVFRQYFGEITTDPDAQPGSMIFNLAHISIGEYLEDGVGCDNPQQLSAYFMQSTNAPPALQPWPENLGVSVLCPLVSTLPSLLHMNCCQLEEYVSQNMEIMGGIVLNQFLHWSYLVHAILDPPAISDRTILGPGFPTTGFGPYNAMLVSSINAGTSNADNYVWLALESYWRMRCPNLDFGPAKEDFPGVDVEPFLSGNAP